MQTYLQKFKAQNPAVLVETLHKEKASVEVVLGLKNGTYIQGMILSVTKQDHRSYACIQSLEMEVVFFDLQELCSVTIKNPKAVAILLSQGAITRPLSTQEHITVLELKRWIKDYQQQQRFTMDIDVSAVNLQDQDTRLNCKDVIIALYKALDTIAIDALAISAIEQLQQLKISESTQEKGSVCVWQNTLELQVCFTKALPKDLHTVLAKQIEESL